MQNREILKTGYGEAFDAEYDKLPAGLKLVVTPKEFAWTEPEQRARLIEAECYPDVAED